MPPLLPVLFSLSVWVFHIFETLLSMSSTVTGGEGQIQLNSFRKEAKKGSAKAAVLISKDTCTQCQAQHTNHSVLPQFLDPRAHSVVSLKDQNPSVNAHV